MRRLARTIRPRFAYEAAFGTALGTDYYQPEAYSVTPPGDPDFVDDPVFGGSYHNARDPIAPVRALPGGQFTVEVPFDLGMLGHWIRQLVGAPAPTGSNPNYVHTKASGAETLESVTWQIPYDSGDVAIANGCVLNELSLDLAKTADYQRIMLTYECRDWEYAGAVLSGSAASAPTSQKLTKYAASVKWNDTIIGEALAGTFRYNNGLERYNTLSGDAYPTTIDTGLAQIDGTLRLRSSDETYRAISKGDTFDDLAIVFALASDSTNRRLVITLPKTRLRANGDPITGPGNSGIEGTYNFRGEQTSGAAAATFVLRNGTATYEPA